MWVWVSNLWPAAGEAQRFLRLKPSTTTMGGPCRQCLCRTRRCDQSCLGQTSPKPPEPLLSDPRVTAECAAVTNTQTLTLCRSTTLKHTILSRRLASGICGPTLTRRPASGVVISFPKHPKHGRLADALRKFQPCRILLRSFLTTRGRTLET